MKEYEYSFRVNDITPYIDYCKINNYDLEKSNYQIRELFKHENKILARITTEVENKRRTCVLDFKDDNDTNKLVKEARETVPLKVSRDNRKAVDSMLEILGYHKDKTLKRKRVVYKKGEVKFEVDEYLEPEICYVVAIEGEKEAVDKVYEEISVLTNND